VSPVSEADALAMAAAVERHSLHPIAKALVEAAQARQLPALPVEDVKETIGRGIEARVATHVVAVHGTQAPYGEMRGRCEVDGRPAAVCVLQDRVKPAAREVFVHIQRLGIELAIATGDRLAAAERVVRELDLPLQIEAECTPETKLVAIRARQKAGRVVGMV